MHLPSLGYLCTFPDSDMSIMHLSQLLNIDVLILKVQPHPTSHSNRVILTLLISGPLILSKIAQNIRLHLDFNIL